MLKFGILSSSNWQVLLTTHLFVNECGLVVATPTRSCIGCQKLIKAPIGGMLAGLQNIDNWNT